jgi:hypothetical protein
MAEITHEFSHSRQKYQLHLVALSNSIAPRLKQIADILLPVSQVTFALAWGSLLKIEVLPPLIFVSNVSLTLFAWYIYTLYGGKNDK